MTPEQPPPPQPDGSLPEERGWDDPLAPDEPPRDGPSASEVVARIASGDAPEYSSLRALSAIDDRSLEELRTLWPELEAERRRELLASLSQLGSEEALLDFQRIHLSALLDPDTATRILAVRGIAVEEDPRYLGLLCSQLGSDPVPAVRAEIADALGGWVISMEFGLLSEEDAEELQVVLTDRVTDIEEETEVRARSMEALGACSDETVGELIGETYEIGSERLRVAAICAMGRSAQETWLPILVFSFDDEDPEIRSTAATAAGLMLAEGAVAPLSLLLDDPELDVQLAAIAALGEIANEEGERILTRLVRESSVGEVREAAEEALQHASPFAPGGPEWPTGDPDGAEAAPTGMDLDGPDAEESGDGWSR